MAESTDPPREPPRFVDAETALGGADAVEKTTYVRGEGTDPNAMAPPPGTPPPTGGVGGGWVVWTVVALAVIVALVYLVGVTRR